MNIKGAKFETVKFDLKNKNRVSVHLIKKKMNNIQYVKILIKNLEIWTLELDFIKRQKRFRKTNKKS